MEALFGGGNITAVKPKAQCGGCDCSWRLRSVRWRLCFSISVSKAHVDGLSYLFPSPAMKSSSYSGGSEESGSLWHDRAEELSSSFRCTSLSEIRYIKARFWCFTAQQLVQLDRVLKLAHEN
ncbi:unnamed protein product [Fraxinus pennsylvanica]|uniref:Uncharacterized protein n=1 Tax=Fraxinus pennsylvanica TaxID=56036 RepID=A0AAD1ZCI3_9LAMI|nr:unnamed protein product [Fraxinus pennsylvanica]